MVQTHTPCSPVALNEKQAAAQLNISVFWLRKDRRTKRIIPFYRIGDLVRYDLETVRQSLLARTEGGRV